MLRAHLIWVVLVTAAACTSEEGTTPECADVDACNPPPVCAEAPDDPIQCCKTADGEAFTGADLDLCLIGYGKEPIGGVGGSGNLGGGGSGPGGSGGTPGGAGPGGAGGAGGG